MDVYCSTEIIMTRTIKIAARAVDTPYWRSEIPRWIIIWVTV